LELDVITAACPTECIKVRSRELTRKTIREHANANWVVGNSVRMRRHVRSRLLRECLHVSCIEFDYRWLRPRALRWEVSELLERAQRLHFVSEGQRRVYEAEFPRLASKARVQGVSYTDEELDHMDALYARREPSDVWAVLDNGKATEVAVRRCEELGRRFELIGGLSPSRFRRALAQCCGLVFHPAVLEGSSRVSVEAKLLGLELDLNENVPICDEPWFAGPREGTLEHLRGAAERFWAVEAPGAPVAHRGVA
jgi:hypothetical protein